MRVTFVHTSSMMNMRGSERWLTEVCRLLSGPTVKVRLVNFDYDQRYARDEAEKGRRSKLVRNALGATPWIRLSALRMRSPSGRLPFGKWLSAFVEGNFRFVPLSREFHRILRDSDVIYFLWCQPTSYLLAVLGASTLAGRRPVIVGIHVKPRIASHQAVLLKIFRAIGVLKGFHLITRTYESEMKDRVGGRLEYVPNGIHVERYISDTSLKYTSGFFSILFVGAMTFKKGIDIVPEIYDSLSRRTSQIRLIICTPGGPYSDRIEYWSKIRSDVTYRGYVDDSELKKMYNQSNLVLLPSRDEQFPFVPLEAQASCTPVVATDISGFRQCMLDGTTGFLASPFSAESFAARVEEVYDLWRLDRDEYLRMCTEARKYVSENYQWRRISQRLKSILNEAAA